MIAQVLAPTFLAWGIAGLATVGVIARPFGWPEAVWAVSGALLLVLFGLMPPADALKGITKGTDVYLFLSGMMLLSELARKECLFDWAAGIATAAAKGSATRLFLGVYAVGTIVTVFLSNDATAVVLTPAVYAAVRTAKIAKPLPYLFTCAFIANAASFVLPISNPANLVVFGGGHMPPLLEWLKMFLLPSLVSVVITFVVLRLTQARTLTQERVATDIKRAPLSRGGKIAGSGIVITAVALIGASAAGTDLGLPTFISGLATALIILIVSRESPASVLKNISWGVLPLVAGLFVLVAALDRTGVIKAIADALRAATSATPEGTAAAAGVLVAFVSNLVNNLPSGLVAGSAVQSAPVPKAVAGAILIGVDLGPNLSVTGSLATILWLTALRREGETVAAWQFLKLGAVVMIPALVLSIGALLLVV